MKTTTTVYNYSIEESVLKKYRSNGFDIFYTLPFLCFLHTVIIVHFCGGFQLLVELHYTLYVVLTCPVVNIPSTFRRITKYLMEDR